MEPRMGLCDTDRNKADQNWLMVKMAISHGSWRIKRQRRGSVMLDE